MSLIVYPVFFDQGPSFLVPVCAAFFHLDGFSGAFFGANPAAFAVFEVYAERKLPRNHAVRAVQPTK
jgi:hypothetical protein